MHGFLAGGEATGAVDSSIQAKVSKTNKELGLRPRMIVIAKTYGTAPDTFQRYARIPILTLATWNSDPYQVGSPFSYRASAGWTIINRLEEDV